jgi:hypothetical protein
MSRTALLFVIFIFVHANAAETPKSPAPSSSSSSSNAPNSSAAKPAAPDTIKPGQEKVPEKLDTVSYELEFRNAPGFAGKIRVFEINPKDYRTRVGRTGIVPKKSMLPVTTEVLPSGEKFTVSGIRHTPRQLALVIENPTSKPWYFYTVPHTIDPIEDSFGFKFQCFCNGDLYLVRPKSWWFRIVQLDSLEGSDFARLRTAHTLYPMSEREFLQKRKILDAQQGN